MKTLAKQQRGVTLTGLIMVLVVFLVVAIFGMKLIPVYMEDAKIQKAFDVIVHDPAMQDASVKDIRTSFDKRAVTMDSVAVISANDIEISKDNGGLALSASYNVKVPVVGNISLLIEFNPSAPK